MAVQPARDEFEFNLVFFGYYGRCYSVCQPEAGQPGYLGQLGQDDQLCLYDGFISYHEELESDLQVRFSVHHLNTNGLSATPGWAESIDGRQNERGGCRNNRTFLHQHRALADRGPQSYQERNGD